MAAGLGFKDFTTGEVLTAADVDGYLMQGIWVFASAAARDAAVTSPQEGNFAFLKDTNTTTYYTGSAWTNLDTTGMVNPMTTTGDTIYSSSGSTPARLGIGTAGQVLQVNSGATAPEWATPAGGGGLTLLSTTTLAAVSTTITSISGSYTNLLIIGKDIDTSSGNSANVIWRFNSDTGSNYKTVGFGNFNTTKQIFATNLGTSIPNEDARTGGSAGNFYANVYRYTDTSKIQGDLAWQFNDSSANYWAGYVNFRYEASAAITSFTITNTNTESMTGTVYIYGVK